MSEGHRQEPGRDSRVYIRAPRAKAAFLPRAPSRRNRGYGSAVHPACERSHGQEQPALAPCAGAGDCAPQCCLTVLPGGAIATAGPLLFSLEPDRRDSMHDHLAGNDHKPPQLVQIATAPYQKPHDHHTKFLVGLDVGSTTVKAPVVDATTDESLWQVSRRHKPPHTE